MGIKEIIYPMGLQQCLAHSRHDILTRVRAALPAVRQVWLSPCTGLSPTPAPHPSLWWDWLVSMQTDCAAAWPAALSHAGLAALPPTRGVSREGFPLRLCPCLLNPICDRRFLPWAPDSQSLETRGVGVVGGGEVLYPWEIHLLEEGAQIRGFCQCQRPLPP